MKPEAEGSDLRVLYVSHVSLVSGAEGALLDLLEALPARVVPFLACPPGPLADRAAAIGVRVVELPEAAGSLRLDSRQLLEAVARIARAGRVLRRQIEEIQPDVIHSNTLRAGLVTAVANLPRRRPTVLHVHDVLPRSRASAVVRRILLTSTDSLVPVSRYAEQRLLGDAVLRGATRSAVLYNPLDLKRFSLTESTRAEARSRLGFAPEERVIALIAQITPWKGHDVAIRMMPSVIARHPQARLILVGEPKFVGVAVRFDNLAYLRRLHALVEELRLQDNVEFWGERSDVPTVMRGIDVLVCPSWEEPFGRSVIEAMSSGTAVVATNVGGPAEYIDEGTEGLLAPPRDSDAWAVAVSSLLDDDAGRLAMGDRASHKVRSLFDRDLYARRVVELYDETVPRHRAGRRASALRPAAEPARPADALKVLFVEHSSEIGGAQHSLLELVRALKTRHAVTVAVPEGPLAQVLRRESVTVVAIPASQLTFRLSFPASLIEGARAVAARSAIARCISRGRPDIVHANTLRAGLITPRFRWGAPLVVHCRDLLPAGSIADLVRRSVMSRSSAVIAVSTTAAARFAGPDWRRRNVFVVDNPVDTTRFDPALWDQDAARRHLGISGGPVLGLVAQITPWKGQHRAIKILARLRARHPNAVLVLAGEPKFVTKATSLDNLTYQQELAASIDTLGLSDSVLTLGERNDVERLIAALDVLLVPSTEEPFGRSVIEALAMNVPVLATDVGGPPEVIRPGVDGETMPPDHLDAWADAVDRWVKGGRPESSRAYAVERFSPERHVAAVVAVYRSLLARVSR
jgi:L-malate glycosyltransferase